MTFEEKMYKASAVLGLLAGSLGVVKYWASDFDTRKVLAPYAATSVLLATNSILMMGIKNKKASKLEEKLEY